MADLMAELRAALDEAAEDNQPMRIGSDVVLLLRAALNDLDRLSAERGHIHVWQPLGWDRGRTGDSNVHVAQACACGAVRESTTSGVIAVSPGGET